MHWQVASAYVHRAQQSLKAKVGTELHFLLVIVVSLAASAKLLGAAVGESLSTCNVFAGHGRSGCCYLWCAVECSAR
jgi:hypothetical protein